MIDFTGTQEDYISSYSGSDRKKAVLYKGNKYMLKYAEKRAHINEFDTSNVNNAISEYVSCQIAKAIGYDVQETVLGTYNGEVVVGCKNFLKDNEVLHEFSWYLRKEFDSADLGRVPNLSQIEYVFDNDSQLSLIKDEAVKAFWELFVFDALVGNFDRHAGNWGYIINADNGSIKPAPVYDCGSSLYPALSEAGMAAVLDDDREIEKRVYTFPTAALSVGAVKKISYYDMLSSGYSKDCTAALLKIYEKIDLLKLTNVIDNMTELSDIRKNFYIIMLSERKEKILEKAYNEIKIKKFNTSALDKIEGKISTKNSTLDNEIKNDISISENNNR